MNESSYRGPLTVITSLFFMWGFITCLNDILIPYLKNAFELTYFQANLVQFAFFGAYFVGSLIYYLASLKFGDPISKVGYKKGMVAGLVMAAFGCSLFFPAAQLHLYGFFLAALFCLGLGLTMLQIAANPYVALLGKPETASSRLNLAQAFNSFGTTIAPVIGGYLIFQFFISDDGSAEAVKIPYLLLAAAFLLLALVISRFNLPKITGEVASEKGGGAFSYPQLRWGMVAIFCYVGAEVAIGSNLVAFLGETSIAGMNETLASRYLALYWGGAMTGRFVGAIFLSAGNLSKKMLLALPLFILSYVLIIAVAGLTFTETAAFGALMGLNFLVFLAGRSFPSRTLAFFALVAAALLLVGSHTEGNLAMWAILGVGLFNSIMWSNIFTLSIAGLNQHTSQGSSLLVMMILGGALVAPLQGLAADFWGIRLSFLVPVICYFYLVLFGLKVGKLNVIKG